MPSKGGTCALHDMTEDREGKSERGRERESARVESKTQSWMAYSRLSTLGIDILGQICLCCGASCAWCGVWQHPCSLPTRGQEATCLPELVASMNVSRYWQMPWGWGGGLTCP